MKIRAAVLNRMGAETPYAALEAAVDRGGRARPARPRRGAGARSRAAGLCHSDLSVINGDRPRPMPMVLGHEAAGVVEKLGPGRRRPRGRRPRRDGVRAELRPLPALRGRPAGAVRARRGRQRRRHAAVGRAAAAPQRRRRPPSSRRLGVRRIRDRVAPLAGQDRSASCRSTRRRCSAARCSPASARWSTPRRSRPARASR